MDWKINKMLSLQKIVLFLKESWLICPRAIPTSTREVPILHLQTAQGDNIKLLV